MSVNAINAAEAQQPKKSNAGKAVATGVGLGAVGALGGYVLGNKRPDLEQVFIQAPDTFSTTAVKEADAEAAKVLQDAVNEYKTATAGKVNDLAAAGKARHASILAQAPEGIAELDTAVNTAKDTLKNKKVTIGDVECTLDSIKQELKAKGDTYRQAKNALKNAGDAATDVQKQAVATAREELQKVAAKRKSFIEGAAEEVSNLRQAIKNQFSAKQAKFSAQAAIENAPEKGLQTAFETAKNNLKEARQTKLTEIFSRDGVKNAFEKIKSAIPKEGGTRMAMYVGIGALIVGLIAGKVFGGKKEA